MKYIETYEKRRSEYFYPLVYKKGDLTDEEKELYNATKNYNL